MNEFIGAGAVIFIALAVMYVCVMAINEFERMFMRELRRPQLMLPPPPKKKESK